MRLRRATYKVKCPDGVKTVHRDISTAFPLALPSYRASGGVSLSDLAGNNVQLDTEIERSVAGVLYQLNELNETVMMNFWAVYVTYQADPCGNAQLLARKVDEMTSELQRLTAIRLELKSLIDLAVANPANPSQVLQLFSEIVGKHNLPGAPQASATQITDARDAASRWIEG